MRIAIIAGTLGAAFGGLVSTAAQPVAPAGSPPNIKAAVCALTETEALKSPMCVRYFFECRATPANPLASLDAIPFNKRWVLYYQGVFEYTAQSCETFSYTDAWAALQMKMDKYRN